MTTKLKKLKVGPFTFKILVKNNLRGKDDSQLWGLCSHDEQTITLDSNIKTPERVLEVLLHETIHAVFGLGIEVKDEESITKFLGIHLSALLLDNPKLLEIFLEESKARKGRKV